MFLILLFKANSIIAKKKKLLDTEFIDKNGNKVNLLDRVFFKNLKNASKFHFRMFFRNRTFEC